MWRKKIEQRQLTDLVRIIVIKNTNSYWKMHHNLHFCIVKKNYIPLTFFLLKIEKIHLKINQNCIKYGKVARKCNLKCKKWPFWLKILQQNSVENIFLTLSKVFSPIYMEMLKGILQRKGSIKFQEEYCNGQFC